MKSITLLLFLSFLYINGYAQIGFQDHIITDNSQIVDYPYSVFSEDIDGDGDKDIISASGDDKIAWFENTDGQGNFGLPQLISETADNPESIFAIDLDGDNDIDIVSASRSDDKIAWYENTDGLGNFGPEQIISENADGANSVFAIDLDGDNDIDIVSASIADDKIAWYENTDGLGNFGPEQIISENADAVRSVFAIDLDGDLDVDILSSLAGEDKIVWYENLDGQGNFAAEQIISENADGAWSVFAVDIDGDLDIDVLSTSRSDAKIAWYENIDGQGNFGSEQIIALDVEAVKSIYAEDFDNDGDIDVLSSSQGDTILAWYENSNGLGLFQDVHIISTDVYGLNSVYATDLDNDGDVDVVAASLFDAKVTWYENIDGQGSFGSQEIISMPEAYWPTFAISNDLDGDGDEDILASSSKDNRVAWYENTNGQGAFGPQQTISTNAEEAQSVFASDLDGDGDLDVLSASRADDKVVWYENTDGLGNFGSEQIITLDTDWVYSVYASDLDGDGDMDVLSASTNDDKVAWYENINGLGVFGIQQVISTNLNGPKSVLTGDLDGDGDQDILSASASSSGAVDGKIAWFENLDGQGNFGEAQIVMDGMSGTRFVNTSDIDADGDLDMLSASFDGIIAWHQNIDGQGNFGPQKIITTIAYGGFSVYAADVDLDGDMDVLSASLADDKIAWYQNTDGQGAFGVQQNISTRADGARSVFPSDIDGDGDIDVISASLYDSKIAWYENVGLVANEIKGFVSASWIANNCDLALPNHLVMTDNGTENFIEFTLQNGFYQLFPGQGDFVTSVVTNEYYTSNPISSTSNFVGIGNSEEVDFCIEPNQIANDLNITLLPLSPPSPGFDSRYKIVYHNVGTTVLSGDIVLTFNDNQVTFLSASELTSSQTNNTITFDYVDLNPFETRSIDLEFNVFPPPTVEINDSLHFDIIINPIAGDYTEDDNLFSLSQIVIGSFDPNDITVLEGEEVPIEEADNNLHYVIRFQNTGTAEAVNIKVSNRIDSHLDLSTFQLEATSHPTRITFIEKDTIVFSFDGIYLPDSMTNQLASNGFIAYKIKPKSDIGLGDVIYNDAAIFFDFNLPIETNIVSTEFVVISAIHQLSETFKFSISPVPATDLIRVQTQEKINLIEIYNQIGQLVLSNSQSNILDISNLTEGIYFCKVISKDGDLGVKKILKE